MIKYAANAIAGAIFGNPETTPSNTMVSTVWNDTMKDTVGIDDVSANTCPAALGTTWFVDAPKMDEESSTLLNAPVKAKTLKEAAKGTGIYVGTAVNYWGLLYDKAYANMVAQEFTLLTAENGCKMNAIAKSYTHLDFTRCDFIMNFAKQHGMAMRGHNLIWASPDTHNPQFIRNEKNVHKLEQFMYSYIEQAMKHMGDYPFAWDVINEAVTDGGNGVLKDSPWSQIDDFACKIFKKAKQVNPKMELFYNDYNIASSTGWYKRKSDKVFNFVKDLKQRGCGIDGVGFQGHIDLTYEDENFNAIRKNIQRYNKIGIKVHFTEISVACRRRKNCPFWDWKQADIDKQGYLYCQLMHICLDEPNCMSYETWGFTDKQTFMPAPQNCQMMDKDMNKKNAYYCLRYVLANYNKNSKIAKNKLAQGYGQPL